LFLTLQSQYQPDFSAFTQFSITMKLSPMIALPLKGMDDVDWSGPLRAYFGSVYGSTDVFNDEVNTLNKLRQDVRGAVNDNVGRDLLYKYYAQLELLALRIPISENECRINFTWHDAFTHQSNTQHSIAFEKASLLFNLACVNSHIGAETDDLKLAFNRFKDAAGIFTFIVSNFLHAPSTDLSQDTVKALCKLMVAQAQESFVERLLTENSSSSMVPKLAKAASNLYKAAAESLQSVHTDKGWGEKYWHQYCSVKSKYYLSVAHDQDSKSLENNGKYGEAIAHLKIAISNIQEIYKSSVPPQYSTFYDVIITLQDAMKERIVSLEKENDLIYHCTVPSAASIAAITAVEAATPTPMSDLYKDSQELSKLIGKELFEKVIPLSVHQQTSLYSEEKATLLRAEGEKIEIANEELASALEFLDLPNALRSLKSDASDILTLKKSQGIDSQVNDWADQVSAVGNKSKFTFEGLDAIKRTIYDDMKTAERLLQEEEKNYESAKTEFKQSWTQASSTTMNSGLFSDISRIKHDLSNATTSDERLKNILKGTENDIQILKLGPNNPKLRALFDSIQATPSQAENGSSLLDLDQAQDDGTIDALLEQTQHYLDSLQVIRNERDARFVEFKDKVHKDDISGILVLNNKNPDIQETLFKSELAKFQPFQSEFDDSIKRQKILLKELTVTWKKVLENKSVRNQNLQKEELETRRKALINKFLNAYTSWTDAEKGLQKAHEFYQKLLTFTKSTLSNAQDFVSNRGEEALKLRNIMSASSNQNSQDILRDQLSRLSVTSSQSPQPLQSSYANRGSVSSTGYESEYSPAASLTSPVPQARDPSTSSWNENSYFDRSHAPPPASAKPATPTYPPRAPSYGDYSSRSVHPQYSSPPPSQPQYSSFPTQPSYQQSTSQPSYGAPYYGHQYSQTSYQQPAPVQSSYQPPASSQSSNQPLTQSSYQQVSTQTSYQQNPPTQLAHSSYQSQPSYGNYQAQPQYPQSYQQQPPPPQIQYNTPPQLPQTQTYESYNSPQHPGSQYGYSGAPAQKDYSKMPPPPPPPGQSQSGQGYYR
jgi:hypothetical protein